MNTDEILKSLFINNISVTFHPEELMPSFNVVLTNRYIRDDLQHSSSFRIQERDIYIAYNKAIAQGWIK